MLTYINSASNHLVKDVKQLKNKNKRSISGLYIAEGENVVKEAIAYMPGNIKSIFVTKKYQDIVSPSEFDIYCVPDYVMEGISDTKSPQGVLAVMRISEKEPDLSGLKLVVYLDNLSDPGNIGTVIRTADAAGIRTVILSPECADVYSPKIVRATMGSCFHIDIYREKTYLELLKKAAENGCNLVAGSLQAMKTHYETDFTKDTVICLGNEAHGLSEELLCLKNVLPVKIPILGKAESLNVSVAGAVLIYEALRQRGDFNE